MLLLHGLPGNEQNLDLAQAVRRAGWNVLTLHYRGSWGSPGRFSLAGAGEDVDAAMAFLRQPGKRARIRHRHAPHRDRRPQHGRLLRRALRGPPRRRDRRDPDRPVEHRPVGQGSCWPIPRRARTRSPPWARTSATRWPAPTPPRSTGEGERHAQDWDMIDDAPGLAGKPLLLIGAEKGNARRDRAAGEGDPRAPRRPAGRAAPCRPTTPSSTTASRWRARWSTGWTALRTRGGAAGGR